MTSLLTNSSAMTALQTLTQTNKNMEMTQNRIATGLRVNTAEDNAAYWSIATTMKSDNKALGAVQDALGLGAATIDVAYTGLNTAVKVMDQMKAKLVAASQPGVDRAAVQAEIAQLQDQLVGISSSASFSGENWLKEDTTGTTKSVVSSFSRDASGIAISTIEIETSTFKLFNAGNGILDTANSTTVGDGAASVVTMDAFSAAVDFAAADDEISFYVDVEGTATAITIDQALVQDTLGDTSIASANDLRTVVAKALENAGVTNVTVGVDTGALTFSSNVDAADFEITGVAFAGTNIDADSLTDLGLEDDVAAAGTATSISSSIADIDIASADTDTIKAYAKLLDDAIGLVKNAASDLGAVKSRIGIQQDFVTSLIDAIDRGVGALVDADMNEESTRLQALQVQQQLGIQALSIANSSSQNILALFR